MLAQSQRVRDELADAVQRLDSYIDLLRVELAQRDAGPAAPPADEPRE